MVVRGRWGDDGGGGGFGVMMMEQLRERGEMVRVRASGYGDRVDRVTRSHFGVRRKNPPENFSDGGAVVAGGEGGLPDNGERRERV
ncbi:hypothetical protein Tco_0351527 [Tanacetum coccineum]